MWKLTSIMFAVIHALIANCLANNKITVINWNIESGGAEGFGWTVVRTRELWTDLAKAV